MNELVTFGLEFVGFLFQILFWMIVWHFAIKAVRGFMTPNADEREELVEKIMTMLHRIKQEKHGDVYYWFDADSDAFLAQGTNDEEIKQHLKERFKGHVFLLDEERAWAGPELQVVQIAELKMKNNQTIA